MKLTKIHDFKASTEEEFIRIQNCLLNNIVLEDCIKEEEIKLCAGVDIAYWDEDGENYGACSIIVVDYRTKEIIEKVESYGKIDTPYIPGFLAFRELPLIVEAVSKLELNPDIFIFDGNGYLHFNHMGIATHASFFLNKPTIGVAKSYLKVKGVDYKTPENKINAYKDIIIEGETYGRALRTRVDVKPIFISSGNFITLETTTKIVSSLVEKDSRLPLPVRLADLETHELRRKYWKNK